MTARQLTLEDCQAVSDLEKQLFHGRFDSTTLRALLVKPTFYGVVLPAPDMPKTIHAYCLAYITSMQADIIALGTDKTKQGQGFGRIILQYLIDVTEQQNVLEITLEVAADNIPARRLYNSFGFHVFGIRKDYYYRGENRCDAVIMVRQRGSAFP
jgi:ribosomal-protein-alanine N-acetyltransferase